MPPQLPWESNHISQILHSSNKQPVSWKCQILGSQDYLSFGRKNTNFSRSHVPIFNTEKQVYRRFMTLVHRGKVKKRMWRKSQSKQVSDQIPANLTRFQNGKQYAHSSIPSTSLASGKQGGWEEVLKEMSSRK